MKQLSEVQGATAVVRLHIVVEGQKDIYLTATATISTSGYVGTWGDRGKLCGSFVFGAHSGGPLRPTPALPQQWIGAVCAPDSAGRAINAEGPVVCDDR